MLNGIHQESGCRNSKAKLLMLETNRNLISYSVSSNRCQVISGIRGNGVCPNQLTSKSPRLRIYKLEDGLYCLKFSVMYSLAAHVLFSVFSVVCQQIYVVVLASYMLVGPTFLLNSITQLLWRPHKLLLSNYSLYLCLCKWQPPRSPFASALVMDWYQYSGCHAMHAHGTTL